MPGVAAVTFAMTVQLPGAPPGMMAPGANVIELPPAGAVTLPPTHVVLALGLGARTTPDGNASTTALISVAAEALAFVKVIVSVEMPPGPFAAGPNVLASPTGPPGGGTMAQNAAFTVLLPAIVTEPGIVVNSLPSRIA